MSLAVEATKTASRTTRGADLMLFAAITFLGLNSSSAAADDCAGGGNWCHPTGDCAIGAGSGQAPREHSHNNPDGCTGEVGQKGECNSDDGGNEWTIHCTKAPFSPPGAGICEVSFGCTDPNHFDATVIGVERARCDEETCVIRSQWDNKCYVHQCRPGDVPATEISCVGQGV